MPLNKESKERETVTIKQMIQVPSKPEDNYSALAEGPNLAMLLQTKFQVVGYPLHTHGFYLAHHVEGRENENTWVNFV